MITQETTWAPKPEDDEEILVELREEEEKPESGTHEAKLIRTPEKAVDTQMQENVQKMGEMILQLGTMIGAMQRRLDEMEARQAAVTVSHRDVLQMMARIRWKAGEICRKYNLQDEKSPKVFRAAIRKDLMKRYQLKDLHDLPAAMLPAAEKQIDSWTDIRLVMERRGNA